MPSLDLKDLLAEARRMQQDRPGLTLFHLLMPVGVLVLAVTLLALTGALGKVSIAAATSFFSLGKLIILSGAIPDKTFSMSAMQLAAMVVFMDCLYAYLLAYNLHHLYRLPRVGPWLERVQSFCRYWLSRRPWMKRWAFTGVMLFVLFPLTGTGAPGGSILGRLVGLRPRTTLLAIAMGSVLGCGLMASFAAPLEPLFHGLRHEWWFEASGVAVLAILVFMLLRLGRRLAAAAERYNRSQDSGGQA